MTIGSFVSGSTAKIPNFHIIAPRTVWALGWLCCSSRASQNSARNLACVSVTFTGDSLRGLFRAYPRIGIGPEGFPNVTITGLVMLDSFSKFLSEAAVQLSTAASPTKTAFTAYEGRTLVASIF
jgi:hypothetical protein